MLNTIAELPAYTAAVSFSFNNSSHELPSDNFNAFIFIPWFDGAI